MHGQPQAAAERLPLRGLHASSGCSSCCRCWPWLRFSLEGAKLGTWSLTAWKQIASYQGEGVPPLLSSIEITLELAVITCVVMLVLLVPTMIWVRLRVQWLARTMEFLCLLPLTIPAIVLVVGLGPIYNRIQHYSLSALMLFWVYVILALPYAYRALAAGLSAIDVTTLSEAARSLGASWFTVMVRVIAPNMRQAILNALLLTSVAGARRVHHRLSSCCTTTCRWSCTPSAGTRRTPG